MVNPRTQNINHMKENLDIFDFSLSSDDVLIIQNLPNKPPAGHNKVCADPHFIP